MKPNSYSMDSICNTLIDHLLRSRTELTNIQKDALERCTYQGDIDLSDPLNLEVLRKFYGIFNDIFFNGVLTGHCTIGRYARPDATEAAYCETQYRGTLFQGSSTRDTRFIRECTTAELMFNKPRWPGYPCYDTTIALGALLHEMSHAYQQIFTCYCDDCYDKSDVHDGFFGHGLLWQRIAHALEKATGSTAEGHTLFNMQLDMNIIGSLATALANGATLSTEVILDLEIDVEWLLQRVEAKKEIINTEAAAYKALGQIARRNACHTSQWLV